APTALVKGGMVTEFDLAGDAAAFIRDEMSHPPAVYARRGDGAERKAESFNDALLRRFQLGASEELSFRGWGGETVQMWLVFPPRFDPRKKYPLLHSIHGGPHAISADSWHFRWNNQVFAAQGYIVAGDSYPFFAKELGAWYWEDFGKVEAQNPRAAVKRMQTPTLVVHGALDYRVPDSQGLQYYNTLKAKKVPTRLLHFPDENHWILKPQNSRLWYREFFAWLRRFDAGSRGGGAPS